MERIARALELAQAEHPAEPLGIRRVITGDAAALAGRETVHVAERETPVVTERPAAERTEDTPLFGTRTVHPDRVSFEHERVLPPGASGAQGASYKLLRTQVLQRLDQLGASTLAILSAAEAEGKTLTAINLAIAVAAELGRTALLVDFDLRNPNVHRRLGFEPTVGVEACLQSGRPVQEALVRLAGYPRLSVLPARDKVEHSSELVGSQRAASLVNELRTRYSDRIVIFDLPPVLHSDDALAFSRLVQAGLFVIAERRTQRDELASSLTLLRELPIIGTVLNGSREPVRAYY